MANIKIGDKMRVKGTKIIGVVIEEWQSGINANPKLHFKLKHDIDNKEIIYDVEELTFNLEK